MRRFHLSNTAAENVAEGVVFNHGMVVVHWKKKPNHTQMFRSVADLIDSLPGQARHLYYLDGGGSVDIAEPEPAKPGPINTAGPTRSPFAHLNYGATTNKLMVD